MSHHNYLEVGDDGMVYILFLLLEKVVTDRIQSVGAKLSVTDKNLEWLGRAGEIIFQKYSAPQLLVGTTLDGRVLPASM